MATRKTAPKTTTVTQSTETPQDVAIEQKMKEKGNGTKPVSIKTDGDNTDYSAKADKATRIKKQPDGGVTLEQALKEEDEGRTPESINSNGNKPGGLSKMAKATKIMEEVWEDIQSGKVKRKDVIKRFMEEIPLSKAGSSTYYSNCKQKIMKDA